jgi:hypothetical protein
MILPKTKVNKKLFYKLLNKNGNKLTKLIKRKFLIIKSKHK